nr:MAG TPA: hypothetical protein [Caudoviricetes sp.]
MHLHKFLKHIFHNKYIYDYLCSILFLLLSVIFHKLYFFCLFLLQLSNKLFISASDFVSIP